MRPLTASQLESLAEHLAAVTAQVASWTYRWQPVDVGWLRPHGELVLVGPRGREGRGEMMAFTEDEHDALQRATIPAGPLTAAVVPGTGAARCALEAAVLDLGLRQRGIGLCDLVDGAVPDAVDVGVCRSFEQVPQTVPDARLKIDHHPGQVYDGLVLAVLDYKGKPPLVDHPSAIFEDPPGPCRVPWSLDQGILTPADVAPAAQAGATHINLKAGRMQGFIATLQAAACARHLGLRPYWGGQWELGVGRRQALQLAALVCPDEANDIAPAGFTSGSHVRVPMSSVGFGGG